ncbi:MAG TPA: NADP-dependent isocitrate dehydrogenase [Candidatus Mailhella merdigallinarum]|uniref:isocitrate dehydrogenase (NADP(+)) n=1 Tax=Candidatus Mailhella merdigallinarum TaxID=2838658 RepID=A0A9D2HE02_9BACT|nr:NADP-dependent isocitrate dehydrogenase [Candidatus Mailhella merdigallinarum]
MRKTVYWMEGDGIGPEIWRATRPVLDAAVRRAYGDGRGLDWVELAAGEKAMTATGNPLPQETLDALSKADVAIKGPLGTPVGGGFRSLNVTLRQTFDLYACIRPVRWFEGVCAPVRHPERVNMVIFRENTEDVYAGIEYAAGTPEAERLGAVLRDELGARVAKDAALGVKPMTERGSKRLVRRAVRYALDHGLPSVTLVHKGNIMKYTEGAFRAWGYEAAAEFGDSVILEKDATPDNSADRVVIKDRIADAMFQEALLHPEQYSVLASPNLNGDYLSDALAAQVGGLGMAPGVNMSDSLALFEATHGTAPKAAGKDIANPGSLLLSGALMLEHLGWGEAATLVERALRGVIADRTVTPDLAADMPGARAVSCSEFGRLLVDKIAVSAS